MVGGFDSPLPYSMSPNKEVAMDYLMKDYMPVLVTKCDHLLTNEQIEHIKHAMASYALAAVHDSKVMEEAFSICSQHK